MKKDDEKFLTNLAKDIKFEALLVLYSQHSIFFITYESAQ